MTKEDEILYHTIVSKLIKIFDSDCLAEAWLETPNPSFNEKTPLYMIQEEMTPREVLTFVESLEGKYLVQ